MPSFYTPLLQGTVGTLLLHCSGTTATPGGSAAARSYPSNGSFSQEGVHPAATVRPPKAAVLPPRASKQTALLAALPASVISPSSSTAVGGR